MRHPAQTIRIATKAYPKGFYVADLNLGHSLRQSASMDWFSMGEGLDMRGCRFEWALCCLLLLAVPTEARAANALSPDQTVEVAGIQTVCTGVSLDARQDSRWDAFTLKIEFAGPGGQYVGGEHVTVHKADKDILSVTCGGPWLLFRLPPGRYEVTATLAGQTATSAAFVPNHGQGHIILRFSGSL